MWSAFAKFRWGVAPICKETGRYEGMEEKDRVCLNIVSQQYNWLAIPYNYVLPCIHEWCGELFNYATQLENNFNNLNDDKKIYIYSLLQIMFLYCQELL